jgi:serine/threonine protein phosphatase PrpC
MLLFSAALTDIGRMRRQNQDRFVHDETLALYGVADGIGGLPGGAEAAEHTVGVLRDKVRGMRPASPSAFARLIEAVNHEVALLGLRLSPEQGIGTTLTCGLVADGTCLLAHVGDSRCYLYRDGLLQALTEDHTVENEMRQLGGLDGLPESQRGALTRCIGQPVTPVVAVSRHELRVGDRLLFATDGVSRVLGDARLGEVLARRLPPQETLELLVELANRRGGPDNATAVIVQVEPPV